MRVFKYFSFSFFNSFTHTISYTLLKAKHKDLHIEHQSAANVVPDVNHGQSLVQQHAVYAPVQEPTHA